MKKINVLLPFLSLAFLGVSQAWQPQGSRSNALANASVTLNDAWAFHHNPGALGELKSTSVGLSYENRFLLKELQSQGVVFAHPLKVGVISVGGQLFGHRQYRTQRIGAGYSMKLAEFLYAGVQLNYLNLQLNENYGSRNGISAGAGIQALITEDWRIGFSAFNIGRAKLSDFENDRFSTLMRLGTRYDISKKVLVLLEAEKDLDYPLRIKGGVEYEAINDFYLRIGAASQPIELSFGLGYKWKVIQLDVGSAYHQILGWSPNFSLTYIGKEKSK